MAASSCSRNDYRTRDRQAIDRLRRSRRVERASLEERSIRRCRRRGAGPNRHQATRKWSRRASQRGRGGGCGRDQTRQGATGWAWKHARGTGLLRKFEAGVKRKGPSGDGAQASTPTLWKASRSGRAPGRSNGGSNTERTACTGLPARAGSNEGSRQTLTPRGRCETQGGGRSKRAGVTRSAGRRGRNGDTLVAQPSGSDIGRRIRPR